MRDAGNISNGYDLAKMIEGLEREGGPFTVFGGEALLTPLPVLEEIFKYGYDKFGNNAVQSNGALITPAHVELFKQYKVHVGLSLDGPGDLNDSRWAGSLEKTRAATRDSFEGLRLLLEAGLTPSIIVTLYRGNAVGMKLDKLMMWFYRLDDVGVRSIRLHLLEVENDVVRRDMALTTEENITALLALYKFQSKTQIQFDLFQEMKRLLMGDDQGATCIWNACDPYTTVAVRGINGQGESSNCGRTNKEGIDWQKASQPGHERQVTLYNTPQAQLGCQDCRFFFACKGQCPGTAEQGDWRNRSEHCAIWMALFERMERDLIYEGFVPLSCDMTLRLKVDQVMLKYWEQGQNISIVDALSYAQTGRIPMVQKTQQHGDHWDAPDGYQHTDGANVVHGDRGTTVMHGDSDAK